MRHLVITAFLATGAMLGSGCATKKYARSTVAPVPAKVDQVGDQTAGEAMTRATVAVHKAERAEVESRELAERIDNYTLQSSASVLFKSNQTTLTPDGKHRLDQVAAEVKSHNRGFITVEGFTDNAGSRLYSEALSRSRADAVAHYLITVGNVPIYRIHMVGLGEDQPAARGRNAAARTQKRRVEVKVFSADGVADSFASQWGGAEASGITSAAKR